MIRIATPSLDDVKPLDKSRRIWHSRCGRYRVTRAGVAFIAAWRSREVGWVRLGVRPKKGQAVALCQEHAESRGRPPARASRGPRVRTRIRVRGKVRACRVCGCTDQHACPGGCWWVGPDLCSACAERGQRSRGSEDPSAELDAFDLLFL